MAARRHVVAWLSKAEWEQVLEYLYSRDCKLQRDALHRISAWKSRSVDALKQAVLYTCALHHSRMGTKCLLLWNAQLTWCAAKYWTRVGGMGAEELVLLYGLALVRFVNLITERRQKTVAIPLRRLANELKIPEWVVNLRHDVTHGKLPKLSMCRKVWRITSKFISDSNLDFSSVLSMIFEKDKEEDGWDCVMEWLRREYWSRQLGNTPEPQWISEEEESEEAEEVIPKLSFKEQKQQTLAAKLREALRSYVNEQLRIFQELQVLNATKQWSPTAELEWIIAQIKDLTKQNRMQAASEIFLEDGFLVPNQRQLLTLKIELEESEESLRLPRTHFRVWQPLLKALHSQAFTQQLLDRMLTVLGQCKETDPENRSHYLSCWISEILTANHRAGRRCLVSSRNQAPVKNKWKLFNQKCNLQWKKLMQRCLESPCVTTPHILKLIFTYMKPRLADDVQEKLLSICSIYVQDESSSTSMDFSGLPIYTAESLQWKIRLQSKARDCSKWGQHFMEEEEEDDDEEEQEMSEQTEDEEMITEESYEEEYYQMMNMKVAAERRTALQGSAWGVSTEFVKWNEYPLGVVPGQKEDPGCLLLDSYSMMSVLDQQGSESRRNGHSVPTSSSAVPSSQNLWWSQSDLHHIKAELQLF